MLNSIQLNDKTYEELLLEAVAQIPLYSREWTNFNTSDPGITMLENLTAFQLLQQETLDEVSEEARRKLLKLVGFTARETHPATIMVQAPPEGGPILTAGHKLWSGDLPFETTEDVELNPWGLSAVYSTDGKKYRDITYLMDPAADTFAYPFGQRPEPGCALVCVLSGTPELGVPIHLWVQIAEEELRTPFEDGAPLPVDSHVRWQYYTTGGWQDARVEDETRGLLRPGVVTLYLEGDTPIPQADAPSAGCALRCVLDRAAYDRAPRLQSLAAHLFPMRQQYTRVQCMTFPGSRRVELRGRMAQLGNWFVFCREEPNGPYRAYREAPAPGMEGRFYRVEPTLRGAAIFFEGGCGPCTEPDAVKVTCFDNEIIHHRDLGPVYGYEDQIIDLGLIRNVLPQDFSLVMEVEEPGGELAYWFAQPGDTDPDSLCYQVRSRDGQVHIVHPGMGRCRLYLAHCVVTGGERGNLRPGATLEQLGGYDGTEVEARYFCPAPGRGGVTYESVEDLRRRFSAQLRSTSVAVRTEDYEKLVQQTPGLCIHKVKAIAHGKRNLIQIVVKPYTDQALPTLSDDYLRQIQAHLEPRRMLTTRIEILQPSYVPVAVNATLTIRGVTAHAQAQGEALLRELLDHVNGPQPFGGWVRFHQIYQRLSALPFVEAVEMLTLMPETHDGTLVGSDIQLKDHSLCCPGTIRLTLRERGR